ncbi:MAG: hypothetical protein KKC46_09420 [Proteobacteria bacterium]|nr:hypothetical protein [Pseudomonadota bacterium]
MVDSTGEADLRAENVSKVVTGFALMEYKMKQLCMIQSSNSWTETYYKETAADLVGGLGSDVAGIPRLANFPYGEVTWTAVSGINNKFGMEGIISWEDERTNNVPMIARTLLRIARAVTKSSDAVIAAAILSLAGNTYAANATWNNAVIADRDPIQDILGAKALIEIDNYNPNSNGYLLLHPTNLSELLGNANIRNAGQFYTDAVTRNGVVGRLLNLTVISSNVITEGGSQIVIAKEALTWKQVVGLTTVTIKDPGVKTTVRSWEVGQIQVPNVDAICKITGI